MSLVIGHRLPRGGIFLVGDTRVWRYDHEQPGAASESCAKLLILRSDLAVGFAGQLTGAIDPALRALPRPGDAQSDIDSLTRASADGGFSCVVGLYGTPPWESNDPNVLRSSLKLLKIERGTASEVLTASAGSAEGFRLFQSLMLSQRRADLEGNADLLEKPLHAADSDREAADEAHILRVRAAMDEVIRAEDVADVGDFLLEVRTTGKGFKYATYVDVFGEGPMQVLANTNVLPRSVQSGGFTRIRLEGPAGDSRGRRFPAIYFLQGGFGYLYHSSDMAVPRAKRVGGSSVREFVARCRSDHGVLLHGVGVDERGFFSIDAAQ